ncbi:hypothetical protein C4564_01080 [Candidatus Microgenomates bacterium]|nr:MAG: hypothetical protein C4564_01080 [Candidatus Microgenomates bacterium]
MYTVYMHEHIYDIVDNPHLINDVWAKFSPVSIKTYSWLKKGLKNVSILVTSDNGNFVLKFYRGDSSELSSEEIKRNCLLSNKLHHDGLPTPIFVPALEGDILTTVEAANGMQYFVVASKYIKGADSASQYVSPGDLSVIASAHTKFIQAVNSNDELVATFKKYSIKEEVQKIYNDEVKQAIASYLATKEASQEYISKIINYYSGWGNYFWEGIMGGSELVVNANRLVHGDFNTKNVVVNSSTVVAIFDFDNMTIAPEAYDVGRALNFLHYCGLPMAMSLNLYLESFYGKYSDEQRSACLFHAKYRSFYDFTRYFTYYHSHPGQTTDYTVRMKMLSEMEDLK